MLMHSPLGIRAPPGRAANPVSLVVHVFGVSQCVVPVSLSIPHTTLSPPRYVVSTLEVKNAENKMVYIFLIMGYHNI
jgi:hypothetical protein